MSKEYQDRFEKERRDMVEKQIKRRGVSDPLVLSAMLKVARHLFVPDDMVRHAYDDSPLPIGHGQTISQPYIVALMTELLELKGGEKVLEIGTGSGYQAAILAEIAGEVHTVEIIQPLAQKAEETLRKIGYKNVRVYARDGYRGIPEEAPFDGIIVTAAPEYIPEPLIEQLKIGGRMVIPIGKWHQDLVVIKKKKDGIEKKSVIPVIFVPMTGEVQKKKKDQ